MSGIYTAIQRLQEPYPKIVKWHSLSDPLPEI